MKGSQLVGFGVNRETEREKSKYDYITLHCNAKMLYINKDIIVSTDYYFYACARSLFLIQAERLHCSPYLSRVHRHFRGAASLVAVFCHDLVWAASAGRGAS